MNHPTDRNPERYRVVERKKMKPVSPVSIERAREIALALLKYRYVSKGCDINDSLRTTIKGVSKESGIPETTLNAFFATYIIPESVGAAFGFESVYTSFSGHKPDEEIAKTVAFSVLRYMVRQNGMGLDPQFKSMIAKMSEAMGIPISELKMFFATYLLPVAVERTLGLKGWSITPA